ncbi:DMT family transporter [Natranaerofaba carboxydovora]|uniref:DMT family transporter n=1 Tax=Natranaerofaba carboxydovora TaxID=2742683 RepID=UPI001F13F6CD|nr:EamA family transporter [Natranaerofaba carboxydovora]UMZ73651.1 putative inner membrane transporter YicL [Natranaerofaba carboxydovora]
MQQYQKAGYLLIILGGIFWGSTGILGNPLFESDLPTLKIVSMKTSLAALIMLFVSLLWQPNLLKINIKHIPFFILSGLLAQFIFGLGYYNAIRYSGATVAVILLYTAPIYVLFYSLFFFKEELTKGKIMGLILTLVGCFLAVGGFNINSYDNFSLLGVLYGLLAAITYASYTIMGKIGMENYSPFTVATYSLIFGALLLAIPYPPVGNVLTKMDIYMWSSLLGLGFVATFLAFVCYTAGLKRVDSSKASIIVTVEVVAAAILAYYFLGESFNLARVLGITMVLSGIISTRIS